MKRFVAFMACAACGDAAAARGETAPIVVPRPPPQPSATVAPPTAGAARPFVCESPSKNE